MPSQFVKTLQHKVCHRNSKEPTPFFLPATQLWVDLWFLEALFSHITILRGKDLLYGIYMPSYTHCERGADMMISFLQ